MKKLLGLYGFVCLLAVAPIFAQGDEVRGDLHLFGSTDIAAYVFTQEATNGTLVPSETNDGLYTLTLAGISETLSIVQVSPPAELTYNTATFAQDWDRAIEIAEADDAEETALAQVQAELEVNRDVLSLVVLGVQYDADNATIQYEVFIEEFVPYELLTTFDPEAFLKVDIADAPESFDDAKLVITATEDFWATLQSGAQVRRANVRDDNTNSDCEAAQATLNDPDTSDALRAYAQRVVTELCSN